MALLNYPYTTGFLASHESATFKIAGRKVFGLKSLSWKQELGGEPVFGNGPIAIGRTIGQYKASADIEQVQGEYFTLVETLGTYGLSTFNLTASWREAGRTYRIEIVDALIKNDEGSSAQGGAGNAVKYAVDVILPIRVNGKTMIDEAILRGLTVSTGLLTLNQQAAARAA